LSNEEGSSTVIPSDEVEVESLIDPREADREFTDPVRFRALQGPGDSPPTRGDGSGVISLRKFPIDGDPAAEFGDNDCMELDRDNAAAEGLEGLGIGIEFDGEAVPLVAAV